ncbi:MAG TPA: allantoate amidohydrolase [Solirubrobacteraceae bacterium]|jgi:allantoate deiminase|nr:allantoate amidohydrolase [Solirubrobacteraceae bacterium]
MSDSMSYAAAVLRRCDELAAFSEEECRLTRRFATPALWQAGETVRAWMEAAGMSVRRDAVGNFIGRLGDADRRTLLIGSHLDTVRDAGRYDGTLGILIAIACAQRLRDRGAALPYAIEVVAFADEEGTRYGTSYLASRAFTGCFEEDWLERRDADGITMREALRGFGGSPEGIAGARREPRDLIGYYEVHIEQGPALESQDVPLGVVTAIAGQTGAAITFSGVAGHAGTVPMSLRRDALTAAAEWILAAETLAREHDGLVATVGRLTLEPGAGNVIPGRVQLTLDLRHAEDLVRVRAGAELRRHAEVIASSRGVEVEWSSHETAAVSLSPALTERLAEAVAACGLPVVRLPSGAGHDAAIVSMIVPAAMLFVRCAGGVSHNPAESVTVQDVAAAIAATTQFLELVG